MDQIQGSRRGMCSIKLEGAPNFRDLGGHLTKDGRQVAFGRVYRSGGFENATASDLATIKGLNIRFICDLRNLAERTHSLRRWPAGPAPALYNMDVNTEALLKHEVFADILSSEPTPSGAHKAMRKSYAALPNGFAPHLRTFFAHMANRENLPAVIHCHSGKDRTGFLSAVLLSALDVPVDSIYEDYRRTAQMQNVEATIDHFLQNFGQHINQSLDRRVAMAVADAHPDYLAAAFKAVAADYGSMENYLEKVGGLDVPARMRLHQALLD